MKTRPSSLASADRRIVWRCVSPRPSRAGSLTESHPGESIAVVAHNVVTRTLLAGLLGMGVGRAKDIRQANACVNVLYCSPNTPPAVVTMNSWFHLDPAIRSF